VTELNGELALVAVDSAGNESAPSEPIHVEFSGCTHYFDDATCIDKTVAPSSCTIGNAVGEHSSASAAWLLMAAAAMLVSRLRRR